MPRHKSNSTSSTPDSKRRRTTSASSRGSGDVSVPVEELQQEDLSSVPSVLEPETQKLVSLLFNETVFAETLAQNGIDVKKLPVSKLDKAEIQNGLEALYQIKEAIDKDELWENVEKMTTSFYEKFPYFEDDHCPQIMDLYDMSLKKYALQLMGDFELLESIQNDPTKKSTANGEAEVHPLDEKYRLLKCKLDLVKPAEEDYKVIEKYARSTAPREFSILDIWRVDRDGEGERFKQFDSVTNRRLLWHEPDSAAVVGADLLRGLIIRPHNERKVGLGIYFSSEDVQSNLHPTMVHVNGEEVGFMFLAEVALGKEKDITVADYSYKEAPPGYDSVVARGSKEPYPRRDATMVLDGKDVLVPQAPPVRHYQFKDSFFHRSLYVVYKESQARLRFLVKYKKQRG